MVKPHYLNVRSSQMKRLSHLSSYLINWLEAILGGPPRGIITDQDLGMTNAMQKVMPNTTHLVHYT